MKEKEKQDRIGKNREEMENIGKKMEVKGKNG